MARQATGRSKRLKTTASRDGEQQTQNIEEPQSTQQTGHDIPVAQSIDELHTILANAGEATIDNERYWQTVRAQFPYKADVLYLNNGSIGILPHLVLEAQIEVLRHREIDPHGPMPRQWPSPQEAHQKIAGLINCDTSELAVTHNSTESMNIVAMGLHLNPEDEILSTTQEHTGGWSCWMNRHEQFGNPIRKIDLYDPPEDEDALVKIFEDAIRPETKVLSFCHVTCTTAWRLPVKKICRMARERGIITVVDGAQSVGMIKVDVKDFDCDFFASSTHKWVFSPKGTGLLYVSDDAEDKIGGGYHAYRRPGGKLTAGRFENHASQSSAPLVGFGVAVDFHNAIGTVLIEDRGATMAEYLKKRLAEIPGVKVLTPMSRKLSASMVSLSIGGMPSGEIGQALRQRYKIDNRGLHEGAYHGVRMSCAIHNTYEELDALIGAIAEIADKRV